MGIPTNASCACDMARAGRTLHERVPRPRRLAMHGVGRVAVSHMTLANGVDIRRAKNHPRKKILGRHAPKHGFPLFELKQEAGSVFAVPETARLAYQANERVSPGSKDLP